MIEMGVTKEKIFHIPNGVESLRYDRDYALGAPIVITFVGGCTPERRGHIVQAFKLVTQDKPQLHWMLRLAGTGPLEPV